MGASGSVVQSLQTALAHKDLKLSTRILSNFVKEVDRVAPWFALSGSLTPPSWDKLGKDLERAEKEGGLKLGTRSVWQLISSCIEDTQCREQIAESQEALQDLQDSLSEAERDQKMGARRKRKGIYKKSGLPQPIEGEGMILGGKKAPGESSEVNLKKASKKEQLYPIKDLEALGLSSSEDDELTPADAALLKGEAARYEEERYHPDWSNEKKARDSLKIKEKGGYGKVGPTAPPLPPPYSLETANFISKEDQKKLRLAFPVFDNAEGGRVHAPVEYVQIKELAESVRNYGINANFTISQLERLATYHMTPGDWEIVTKAALPNMGQFLEWKALWHDLCQAQARINAAAEGPQRRWDFQLLELGGPLTNAGLAAAILQGQKRLGMDNHKVC